MENKPLQQVLDEKNTNYLVSQSLEDEKENSDLSAADILYFQGKYSEAMGLYTKLYGSISTSQQDTPTNDLIALYQRMGKTKLKQSNCLDAHHYLSQALDLKNLLNNDDPFGLASIIMDIGEVFLEEAKYGEAEKYFKDSLDIVLNRYGQEHKQAASIYNNLAEASIWEGKYQIGLQHLEKAISIASASPESELELSNTYYLMGWAHQWLEKYSQAIMYTLQSLTIRQRIYKSPKHPDIAKCYLKIGEIYRKQNKYSEAMEHFEKSLQISKKFFGESHPCVSICYDKIGMIQRTFKKYSEALRNYEKCLEIYLNNSRKNHPDTATTYSNLGNLFFDKGNLNQALSYYNQGLEIRLQVFNANHPQIASNYDEIGWIYKHKRQYDKACFYFSKSLEIKLNLLGPKCSEVANSYASLGNLYRIQEDYCKALENSVRSLKIRFSLAEQSQRPLADSYYNFSLLFRATSQSTMAKVCLEKANRIYNKIFGKEHQETQETVILISLAEELKDRLDSNKGSNI